MEYRFKGGPELFWFVATAAVVAVAQILTTLDPATVMDWRTYLVALAAATVRAAAGALLDWISRHPPAEGPPPG